ncbi:MAG: glutathione S-transferase family protein, partial [Acetobacteraceae bacterium]|nr:glutathione S-transferase family protein [Acetobacteraceae bacterium]
QPFEQVPAFRDEGLEIFESGAILLYLAEKHDALLPKDEQARWHAIAWLFAALNSVEPACTRYFAYAVFNSDKEWAAGAKETVEPLVRQKLKRVSDALGGSDWLAGEFSIADIMMVTVLNSLKNTDFVAEYPNLAAYHARGTERPAYQRALQAQLADFDAPPPQRQPA